MDFEQAFDSVEYSPLLAKLHNYGLRGHILKLFASYFSSRKIVVSHGTDKSESFFMTRGCPQGSSLSGITFCVFINDIKYIFKNCKFCYYADGLALYVAAESVSEANELLQQDINRLTEWCKTNCIKINVQKTKSMMFRSNYSKTDISSFFIKIDNEEIETVKTI